MQKVVVNYGKKKVLGEASTRVHNKKPVYETDPELIAATQEAQSKQVKRWWRREKNFTPEMLLSKHDRKILHKVKDRAWYLDKGLSCCGFQIGLDGVVGLIPGIGDVIGAALALQLVKTASQANLPKEVIAKMLGNVMIDFMIGLTPIAGDILDIFFKCNWRNAMILEEYLLLRRRDELRLEKGEAAANAIMDAGTSSKMLPSSGAPGVTKPVAAHHVNNTVQPIITEVDDDGNEITNNPAATTTKKKKYGTFFGRWGQKDDSDNTGLPPPVTATSSTTHSNPHLT